MKAHNGPVDPFSAQKQSLLDNLRLPFERHVLALMKTNSTISEAISQSLLGNKGDLRYIPSPLASAPSQLPPLS